MPVFDPRKTESQQDRSLIPDDVYQFQLEILPGNAGPDGILKVAKNMRQLMLATVSTIVSGEHAKRKVWDYITVDLDESNDPNLPPLTPDKLSGLRASVRIGRNKLRAIIDSALGLVPNDHDEATEAKRDAALESWHQLNGLVYWAETKTKPGENGYGPRTVIDFIVTPDSPNYPQQPTTAVDPFQRTAAEDMDKEFPY
jgi:hypothetical protein